VTRVAADAANRLVWAAGDNGDRIKAFAAPKPPGEGGRARRRGNDDDDGTGGLRYTLWSQGQRKGRHAGLHVFGGRVFAIKGAAPCGYAWACACTAGFSLRHSNTAARTRHTPSHTRLCVCARVGLRVCACV
jgi:hypothetical protein